MVDHICPIGSRLSVPTLTEVARRDVIVTKMQQ